MANPVVVSCPADTWTIVATGVTAGQIHKLSKKPNLYLHTYRMTGGTAPTSTEKGVPIFIQGGSEVISAAAAIDVYLKAVGEAGEVRADL